MSDIVIPEKAKWIRGHLHQAEDRLERTKKHASVCNFESMFSMHGSFYDWTDRMIDDLRENIERGNISLYEANRLVFEIVAWRREKEKEVSDILRDCIRKSE